MSKTKQVHTEQVQPDVIPGQITADEVLEQQNITSGTDSTINAKKRCQEPTSGTGAVTPSSTTQTGAEDTSKGRKSSSRKSGAKDHSENKIVPIDSKRRKSKSGADVSLVDQSGEKQVRKQGQRGKDKQPRKIRYDNNQFMIPADDRQRIVKHNLDLYRLGTLKDRNDLNEVLERIESYFNICAMNAVMPTVAGFALALGVDRNTLWDWMDGKRGTIKNPDVVGVLKRIYSMINTQYEELLTEGKMIPVGAFFLLQNNHGYKNQTDHVVVAAGDPEPDTSDIAARAGLLEDGAGDR